MTEPWELVPTSAAKPLPLTERERLVLQFLSHGLNLGMIAGELNYSAATIRADALAARRKLRAKTNAQAVAIAMRAGLFP